jgi:hypothetical protein
VIVLLAAAWATTLTAPDEARQIPATVEHVWHGPGGAELLYREGVNNWRAVPIGGGPARAIYDTANRERDTQSQLVDIDGDGVDELVLLLDGGIVLDVATGTEVYRLLPQPVYATRAIADLDGDGSYEWLYRGNRPGADTIRVEAWDGTLVVEQTLPNDFRGRLLVAQLDDDPALEVTAPGQPVFEGLSLAVDTRGRSPTPESLREETVDQACDTDGDGIAEYVERTEQDVAVFRGQQLLWQVTSEQDPVIVDVDADGDCEVAIPGPFGVVVHDGTTGGVVATAPADPSEPPCTPTVAADFDSDGTLDLLCDTTRALRLGAAPLDRNRLPEATRLSWRDLDGDGTAELLAASDHGLTVQDPTTLDALTTDAATWNLATADVDGDGVLELYRTDGGVFRYTWSPAGFVPGAELFPSGGSLVDPRIVDVDGNGIPEIVHEVGGRVEALDLRFGAARWAVTGRDPEFADLDGNGTLEVLVSGGNAIYDAATGNRLTITSLATNHLLEVQGRTWVVGHLPLAQFFVYRLAGGTLDEVAGLVAPSPMRSTDWWWLEERIWFDTDGAFVGWSPFDGTELRLLTASPTSDALAVSGRLLRLGTDGAYEVWTLP